MRTIYLFLFTATLALTGCEKDSGSMEEREERDPNVISGQKFMEEGNFDAAIEEFKRALEQEPMMARPHLDLALIFQQHKINYIHALYHYDRYLELRPNAEKADFINNQKHKVAQALANTFINNSPDVKKVVQERNTLIQQNNELKRQLAAALRNAPAPTAKTQQTAAPTTTEPSVTKTVPKSATPAVEAQTVSKGSRHHVYHVVSGDTLSKISTKFYGDSGKYDIIYEANKDMMRNPGDLKVGQTIVIPIIGN
ncbi:LysM peptidoglycan-binding domain-containing protein [Pontiellaceae bacterium B12227]|nr:LysM peptidoglycan-binding domain-containing protein [Pontiellaceae bacterium B12227]